MPRDRYEPLWCPRETVVEEALEGKVINVKYVPKQNPPNQALSVLHSVLLRCLEGRHTSIQSDYFISEVPTLSPMVSGRGLVR